MNALTLVRRGLRFHRRTHLGVIAGCAVSAAVLVGALFVGDSVRATLRETALARLGGIHVALDAGDRFFRDDLAGRVRAGLRAEVAAALRVDGMALLAKKQVNRVEVLGVEAGFLGRPVAPGQAAINGKLAAALGAKAGDEVALRMFKPGLLSREAPLASGSKGRETRRELVTVGRVLSDAELGRFSLRSDQAGPYNAFVDLGWLQERLELEGRANLIVAGAPAVDAEAWLKGAWKLEDAGLSVRAPEGTGVVQLQSDRIYLDPAAASAALRLRPDAAGVLYYLVNSLASESGRSTPYSFMAAGPVPAGMPGMKDDEILVNRWLADQVGVAEGGHVEVAYSEAAASGEFVERRRSFRVRGVIPMEALAAEKALVPAFPGLTDVESCKNWDLGGIPMDEKKLNDEANEKYWNQYRQTPKAFVTLSAGRSMWANRYGDLMTVRYPAAAAAAGEIAEALRGRIDPGEVGLGFRPVREQALRAASESMDLGQLFLGMSLFLIAASLVLTAMLFVFSVEQRAREMGVLRAVGYSPGRVRSLFLLEGAVLAGVGSLAGVPAGWAFAKALVWGLGGAWSGAVAEAPIAFHASAGSAAAGVLAATLISLLAMALALWRQARRPVRELVADDSASRTEFRNKKDGLFCYAAAWGGVGGAVGVAIWTLATGAGNPAANFFGAGSLMLVGGIALVRLRLGRLATRTSARLSVAELGVRNAARRPGRGTATAAMLASGCFIVFSVSAMKEDLSRQSGERRSGTGGFALYGESSIPIRHDLNDPKGRAAFFLTEAQMNGVSILPVRMREGDDATCLNLNQSLSPPLLGIDPGKPAKLGAFADPELWALLDRDLPDGAVPALVGDSATAMWKLKKKVGRDDGDLLGYTDERGREFKVKLVGALPHRLTVFQGRLLISARRFAELYPSEGGSRVFLADVPAGHEAIVRGYLTEKLETAGLAWVTPVERLKEFYAVESAYLRMFFVLGGLGLLLGSAGMGVLVLRHVMERRGELALLRAVGYSEAEASRVVTAEHRWLLAAGLATGTAAAALAVGPGALQPTAQVPWGLLAGFLIGTAVLSLTWIRVATRLALRAPLVPALRNE